jgi:YHS domain-containing protein
MPESKMKKAMVMKKVTKPNSHANSGVEVIVKAKTGTKLKGNAKIGAKLKSKAKNRAKLWSKASKTFCQVCPDWEIKNPERCSNSLKKAGKTMYFCTSRCKEKFQKTPEKFA